MIGWQVAAWALAAFILWFALQLHAHMWRRVAERYRGTAPSTGIARKLEVMVIAERGLGMPSPFQSKSFRKYPGLVLAIHDEGLELSLIPPINILCPPLFLPFDEMELEQTDWALWPEPFAIRMRQLPDVDIIIGRETVRWLREYADPSVFGLGV